MMVPTIIDGRTRSRACCFAAVSVFCCLLAGACLETTGPAVSGSMPSPGAATDSSDAEVRVVGAETCASSGCHGKSPAGSGDWRSAYAMWHSDDPHRRGFEVLYTQRSLEIHRNLHPRENARANVPDEASYLAFLEQRCTGCHATRSPAQGALAWHEGVSCESCHGPASRWIDRHYLASWPGADDPARNKARKALAADGFRDTTDLSSRAAICTTCHAGPVITASGARYKVDHELIAAGHPRLAFELDAYLTNYPKHWDLARDEARYRGSFHVNAWTSGQEQLARRFAARAWEGSPQDGGAQPEFSRFDCFDCHHAIRPPNASQLRVAGGDAGRGWPRPAALALDQLLAIARARGEHQATTMLQSTLADTQSVLANSWTHKGQMSLLANERSAAMSLGNQNRILPPARASDLRRHAAGLRDIIADWKQSSRPEPTWDQAVGLYLAAQALIRDLKTEERQPLVETSAAFVQSLGPENFSSQQPTQYDSPASYDPSRLRPALERLDQALADIAGRPLAQAKFIQRAKQP